MAEFAPLSLADWAWKISSFRRDAQTAVTRAPDDQGQTVRHAEYDRFSPTRRGFLHYARVQRRISHRAA